MATIKLTQAVVDGLTCPIGKKKQEYVDINRTGLYVAATSSSANYYLRYKDRNGKTSHIKLGNTSAIKLYEAKQRVKQLHAEIASGSLTEDKPVPIFRDFFIKDYLPYSKSRKRSWTKDESLFRCHLDQEFGNKRLDQITRSQAELFHMSLVDIKKLSPAQADHAIKVLKTALNFACNHSIISDNPIARFKLFNAPNIVNNILTEEELNRFIHVLKTDKNRSTCLLILWLMSTGSRLNSALASRWTDINRSSRTWTIPSELSKNKRICSIPLNDSSLKILDQLGTEEKYDYLFINHKTGERLKSVHTGFKALRIKAGIGKFRIHDCRHQFASAAISEGRTLYEVSQLLNHRTIITSARYAHLSTKTLQEASAAASKAMFKEF